MPEEPKQQSWWHSIPGILTGIGALLSAAAALIVALRDEDRAAPPSPPPAATAPAVAAPAPARPSPPERQREPSVASIAGVWRDNWGTVTRITQDGSAFEYAGTGSSCRGGRFRSSGAGRIEGNSIQSSFQTDLPSRGTCIGTITAGGAKIDQTCTDSVCGTFVTSADRQ